MKATKELIDALNKAAQWIEDGNLYDWDDYGICNIGLVAAFLQGKQPQSIENNIGESLGCTEKLLEEIQRQPDFWHMQVPVGWSRYYDVCRTSGIEMPTAIQALASIKEEWAEMFGFTVDGEPEDKFISTTDGNRIAEIAEAE
jgi:hypothetical protein